MDSSDNIHVVWSGYGWGTYPGSENVQYREKTSAGWQDQVGLTDGKAPGFPTGIYWYAKNPKVVTDASDNVHVVWWGPGSQINYRMRTSGSWQSPVTLGESEVQPSVATDSENTIHVAWAQHNWGDYPDKLQIVHRAKVGGAWQDAENITNWNATSRSPSLIWATYPTHDNIPCNIPDIGYALVFVYEQELYREIKFHISEAWGVEVVIPEWRRDIQVGDILLWRTTGGVACIQTWTHAGIYVGEYLGKDRVAEARAEKDGGISRYDIADWDYPHATWVILLRVWSANESQRVAAANWAINQTMRDPRPNYSIDWLGKSHDPNSPDWYCSELVWAAYYNQGIDIDCCYIIPLLWDPVSPDNIYGSDQVTVVSSHEEGEKPPCNFWSIIFIWKSSVGLVIVDPDGLTFSEQLREIPDTLHMVDDLDGDGVLEDYVIIEQRKIGDYSIQVVPEPDALPTDTYTLEVLVAGESIVLAEDVPISDIPDQPYLIHSTETEINAAPIADADGPYTGDEGSAITFNGSGSYDPDGTIVSYEWDLDGDGEYDDAQGEVVEYTWGDNYSGNISLNVTDNLGAVRADTATVTVNNVAPIVDAGPGIEVLAGCPVSFSGNFTDPGWLDIHSATIYWGDGTVEAGTLTEGNMPPDATGTVIGNHIYYDKGEYTVTLTVVDDDGGVGTDTLAINVEPISATIDFDPDTLNLRSKGKWVTVYIELPEGCDVAEIDATLILLNEEVAPVLDLKYGFVTDPESYLMDHDGDGILERMMKFDRAAVQEILSPGGEVTVTITGKVLYNDGLADFEGSDVIKVK